MPVQFSIDNQSLFTRQIKPLPEAGCQYEDTRTPDKNKKGSCFHEPLIFLVARGGIEPPTQGFSILCSTD